METNKKNGFTLVEVIIFVVLLIGTTFVLYKGTKNIYLSVKANETKNDIVKNIRRVQKESEHMNKTYEIYFDFNEKNMNIIGEDGNTKINLSPNFSYDSKNTENKLYFKRKTTDNGNFDKGFTIYINSKKNEKNYFKISVNTANSLKYPIISVDKNVKE